MTSPDCSPKPSGLTRSPASRSRRWWRPSHVLLTDQGDVDTAHRMLVGAIEMRSDRSDTVDNVLADALQMLLYVCWVGGRAELWKPFEAAMTRLGPTVPEVLALCSPFYADPVRVSPPALARLDAAVDALGEVGRPGGHREDRRRGDLRRPAGRHPADPLARRRRRPCGHRQYFGAHGADRPVDRRLHDRPMGRGRRTARRTAADSSRISAITRCGRHNTSRRSWRRLAATSRRPGR